MTGVRRAVFSNPRLTGSWDAAGRPSATWSEAPMVEASGEDGCPSFHAVVDFDETQVGTSFRWGVRLDGPRGSGRWGIATEIRSRDSQDRYREFTLAPLGQVPQEEIYYLTHCRRLGAQKRYRAALAAGADAAIEFAVWAPNARAVEVVFGVFGADPREQTGYISDDGRGVDPTLGPIPMVRSDGGIWRTDRGDLRLASFRALDHKPYMFRITGDDGVVRYRTDLSARCQLGKGRDDPQGQPYAGHFTTLDGTKSCSVVIDPETVARHFAEATWPEIEFVPEAEFWADEYASGRRPPRRVEDLVIYELHVGGLGFGREDAGTFADVLEFLPHLVDLGVNAVQLMPVAEFEGRTDWGYGTSHYFALEFSAGGRDQLKHVIRECHRNGLAVLLDVVYNHYHHDAERAQWAYDSQDPARNVYYWYEGRPSDYARSDGGYVDNGSTGYAPRYHEEMVRQVFISSAMALMEEFHVDGFRVDQTTLFHDQNVLHADGRAVADANIFGAKLLREWCRTLRMIRPDVLLIAEDHSEWPAVTQGTEEGGLGFDAAWYAEFYHHLIGDAQNDLSRARLLVAAAFGDDRPLAMGAFVAALGRSGDAKVVYHESHDEAGNSYYEVDGARVYSQRTLAAAVNGAPMVGETRRYAEARSRCAAAITLLSAGTPMFFMGEEVGASVPYRYDDFLGHRIDFRSERRGEGARLFGFYRDLIRFRLTHPGLRSRQLDIIDVHDANRVLAFRRWGGGEEFLIVASLNNRPFRDGYVVRTDPPRLRDGGWTEVFNSDAASYGGDNVGNQGEERYAAGGEFRVVLPANGLVVFRKT